MTAGERERERGRETDRAREIEKERERERGSRGEREREIDRGENRIDAWSLITLRGFIDHFFWLCLRKSARIFVARMALAERLFLLLLLRR